MRRFLKKGLKMLKMKLRAALERALQECRALQGCAGMGL
nr:MAG TPA: hypothetical protein [Caudoviricetes sp.]